MDLYVADTHALIWHLTADAHLGETAKAIFLRCERRELSVAIPTICVVEVIYLEEKGRIPSSLRPELMRYFQDQANGFQLFDLSAAVAETLSRVPRSEVPDMPDRIIAATALHLGVPLISRDYKIQLSAVETVW